MFSDLLPVKTTLSLCCKSPLQLSSLLTGFLQGHLLKRWLIILFAGLFLTVSHSDASTNIPVGDSIYNVLNRLEAEGVIKTGLLTTKPLSRREVARLINEAERSCRADVAFIRQNIQYLKKRISDEPREIKYVKPLDNLYVRFVYSDNDPLRFIYNSDGDQFREGSNFRLGSSSRAELGGRFSLYVNPEIRHARGDTDLVLRRAYGVLGFSGAALTLGRDSQWWGPGRHGAILLSNNALPFTMAKLTNPHPVLLPWIFGHLGPFRYTFFVTRLEEERAVPEPYLWGLRLNFKPHPLIEVGLSRTAMLGGENRPADLTTWLKSFTAEGENDPGDPGDQRAGFDLKLTLPFERQPFQLYIEAAGEDEAGSLPYKWAYLAGIYLPRILGLKSVDFRAEYATTNVGGHGRVWYSHGIFTCGYKYKGRIIGHHMGTDADDIFLSINYYMPELDGRIRVAYNKQRHNLTGNIQPTKTEHSVGIRLGAGDGMVVEGSYTLGHLRNFGSAGSSDTRVNLFMVGLNYYF